MMLSPQYRRAFLMAAALGLAVTTTGIAHAFTVENKDASGSGQGFTDLDIPKVPSAGTPDSRFKGKDGVTSYKTEFGTVQFGSRPSFDQRYNSNSLYDPFARDGR
jgi:hypothetical protein